jgi:hypothetical protein
VSYLFLAAFCIYMAVYAFRRSRNILNMVMMLLFGVAFTALGLVQLMELIAPEWVEVSFWAVIGIMGLCGGITGFYSPPSPNSPRWKRWTNLVVGIGFMLFAGYHVFYHWR